ncbi:hypothetical protein ACB092_07G102400 [Castanea dentata]
MLPLIRGKDSERNLCKLAGESFLSSYILLKIICFIYQIFLFFFLTKFYLIIFFNFIDLSIIIRIFLL